MRQGANKGKAIRPGRRMTGPGGEEVGMDRDKGKVEKAE